jgi:hypothetical protein
MAQKLSHQLRAAEDRILELEAEVEIYRDKAHRAEQWLRKVYTEIDERFIKSPLNSPSVSATVVEAINSSPSTGVCQMRAK